MFNLKLYSFTVRRWIFLVLYGLGPPLLESMKHPCVLLGPGSAQQRAISFCQEEIRVPLKQRNKKKKKKGNRNKGQPELVSRRHPCHKGTGIVDTANCSVVRAFVTRIILVPAILVPLSLPPAWFGAVSVGICLLPVLFCSIALSDSLA